MFGKRLKNLRKDNDLTLDELATLYNSQYDGGLNKGTLSKYENGKQEPMISVVINLAALFNVPTDYLLGKTDNISTKESSLTKRDEKDIEKILDNTKDLLLSQEGLMFDGQPASEESINSILQAMQIGMEMAKQKNKEKYTPKKYKKD